MASYWWVRRCLLELKKEWINLTGVVDLNFLESAKVKVNI
jgi:hypothetical protein